MLAMLDRPTLRLTVLGLGLPGGEIRFRGEVFGVELDRRDPFLLCVQQYAPLPGGATPGDVGTWMGELQRTVGATLDEREAPGLRKLEWRAQRCEDLDAVAQAWLLSGVGISSGGAVALQRAGTSDRCLPALPGHPFAARFTLGYGRLTVEVMPVYAGHDEEPLHPEDARWLAEQLAACGAQAQQDAQAPSSWELASAGDHDRIYRHLTRGG